MGGTVEHLGRDVAHIKDDMRRTAERLWGMDPSAFERIDPVVDLLFSAFAQEIFMVQQDIMRYKQRMVELAAQALLPIELSAPKPAHVVLHGRPMDAGTYTHRIKTVLSTTQSMDVHDRVGRTFTFTPADEFRLHNGAIRYMANGDKLYGIDPRTGVKRPILTGQGKPMPARELWLGLEMKEAVDPSVGLAIYFTLPTNDPDEWQLRLHLPDFRFGVENKPCGAMMGLRGRKERTAVFDRITDPVAAIETEALAYYQDRFITISAPSGSPQGLHSPGPVPEEFATLFDAEALGELGNDLVWLRVELPVAFDPVVIKRLICALNCFPAIDRKRYERSASSAALAPLDHSPENQFWAVEEVMGGDRIPIPRERSGRPQEDRIVYAVRRGGLERIDEREAFERLTDLLHTVRSDHAAFAALDENELAEGLIHVKAWLQEYRTRHKAPPFPPVYLLLSEVPEGNVHVDYWATSGEASARIPAFKSFRLDSGAFLTDVRSMGVPVGGEDTPSGGTLTERLQGSLSMGNVAMPTLFAVRVMCMDALPVAMRENVRIDVRREVMVGPQRNAGLVRTLRVSLRVTLDTEKDERTWVGLSSHLQNVLERRFHGLLPVSVDHTFVR